MLFAYFISTDIDFQVPYNEVRYLISSDAGSALGAQYFIVDDVTGDISRRQSPKLDNAKTVDYTVRFKFYNSIIKRFKISILGHMSPQVTYRNLFSSATVRINVCSIYIKRILGL